MKKKWKWLLGLCFMLTACSGKSLALPEVLGGKRETVTFSDSLYRPDQEFEKISCDVREGCYAVDSEMEAGLLIGNLVRTLRLAGKIAKEEEAKAVQGAIRELREKQAAQQKAVSDERNEAEAFSGLSEADSSENSGEK